MLPVGVILSVGNDDVVEEVDAHDVASFHDTLGQAIVVTTWTKIS
jgi:hypothetical protein